MVSESIEEGPLPGDWQWVLLKDTKVQEVNWSGGMLGKPSLQGDMYEAAWHYKDIDL
jgi:hypothetical protein